MKRLTLAAAAALLSTSSVYAQLTWDVTTGDGSISHSNGVWDTTTANWTADGGANNVAWVNGSNAVFDNNPSNTQVVIDVDTGITLGDLTVSPSNGNGNVILRGLTDNTQMTLNPGGATWALGGRYLEMLNNTSQDLSLAMSLSNTLTIVSGGGTGGTFDTGEKPTGNNWSVPGCTLDFQAAGGTLKGNFGSVGQFSTVKMGDGTTYMHDRNANQNYSINDWDLGTGTVTFKNRWGNNGSITLSGKIKGSGTMVINCNATRYVRLNNPTNDFTGKYIVGQNNIAGSELLNYSGDLAYGPVPATVVPDYFTLVNGGELKLNGFEINANRGITLDGKGVIINNTAPTIYGGKITGNGQLQIGRNEGSDGNALYLTSNTHDYTGGTRIWQGSLTLQLDDTLPADGLLTIGGGSKNGNFRMNGFNQTIGGLTSEGSGTRRIWNNTTTNSTLTINVASNKTYNYSSDFAGTGDIILVKEGAGTQRLTRSSGYTKNPVSITVNGGILEQSCGALPTPITVNAGGTLGGTGTTLSNVVVNSGGSISPGNGGGWNALKFTANLDLSGMIDDNAGGIEIGFGAARDSIVVTNSTGSGTLNMNGPGFFDLGFSDFTFTDDSGVPSGTYALLIADSLSGTLDPTDLSGVVGDKGATGTLSLSNNTVYITIDGADVSPYGLWAQDYGLVKGTELDDFDGDAYNNIQEFAYGGDPTNAGVVGHVPMAGTSGLGGTNWLTIVYGYRSSTNSGVNYVCETANDLLFGTWTGAGVTVLGTNTIDAEFDAVTNGVPIDNAVKFLRVTAEKQP